MDDTCTVQLMGQLFCMIGDAPGSGGGAIQREGISVTGNLLIIGNLIHIMEKWIAYSVLHGDFRFSLEMLISF
jgi:hypothetical protein